MKFLLMTAFVVTSLMVSGECGRQRQYQFQSSNFNVRRRSSLDYVTCTEQEGLQMKNLVNEQINQNIEEENQMQSSYLMPMPELMQSPIDLKKITKCEKAQLANG